MLRALELVDYANAPDPAPGWVAERLGIKCEEVERALELLRESGQVRRVQGRLRVRPGAMVDTGADRERRALRAFWSRVANDRLERGDPGIHAFNLFTIARSDIAEVERLHGEFFARMRDLVARSEPSERVMLYCGQLLPLDREE